MISRAMSNESNSCKRSNPDPSLESDVDLDNVDGVGEADREGCVEVFLVLVDGGARR